MSKQEKTYFIHVRSTGEKVPVSKVQHNAFYKEVDCIGCEYHAVGDITFLDQPLLDGNGTLGDYIHDSNKPMDEVIADRMLLEQLFARLRELDPEANTIQLWKDHPEGIFDRAIADEIFRLREQKEQVEVDSHHREETMKRIKELQNFIAKQKTDITEFDEVLVNKLIEKITVFDDHFTVEFKSGITIEIET